MSMEKSSQYKQLHCKENVSGYVCSTWAEGVGVAWESRGRKMLVFEARAWLCCSVHRSLTTSSMLNTMAKSHYLQSLFRKTVYINISSVCVEVWCWQRFIRKNQTSRPTPNSLLSEYQLLYLWSVESWRSWNQYYRDPRPEWEPAEHMDRAKVGEAMASGFSAQGSERGASDDFWVWCYSRIFGFCCRSWRSCQRTFGGIDWKAGEKVGKCSLLLSYHPSEELKRQWLMKNQRKLIDLWYSSDIR